VNVLDLFSGIGGFSLGLERAGMRTVAFCEIEPFCQRVLKKHWPEVPVFGDVRALTADQVGQVEVICGGFPCQDISLAGSGAGIEGRRSGLWTEYARLIGELQPRYVVVENVAILLGRGMGRVLGDLASLGFHAEWHCIPASYVGAPHSRDRLWIIADRDEGAVRPRWQPRLQDSDKADWPRLVFTGGGRSDDGIPDWLDRVGACGNAVVPYIAELIGRAIVEHERGRT
jgi:DNA (cytosine-5)-methyltransferase 1